MARYLFVSPHPDDAVFSTGGLMARLCRQGHEVAVATVFSRCPDAAVRQREDEDALARLGVLRLPLSFVDLVERRAVSRRMAGPTGEDLALAEPVRAALEPLAEGAITVGPLGVAVHPDHQIVFRACLLLLERGHRVSFYEELPYGLSPPATALRLRTLVAGATQRPSLGERWAAARWWAGRPVLGEVAPHAVVPLAAWLFAGESTAPPPRPLRLVEERHEATDTFTAKLDAAARYGTQWPRFHRSLSSLRADLCGHARRLGSAAMVERLFRVEG